MPPVSGLYNGVQVVILTYQRVIAIIAPTRPLLLLQATLLVSGHDGARSLPLSEKVASQVSLSVTA